MQMPMRATVAPVTRGTVRWVLGAVRWTVLCAIAVIATAAAPTARALDPAKAITQYVLDRWQTESGLPDNSVWAMLQTRDGYMWIGTSSGLVRFDGEHFTVFNSANTPALGNDEVRSLLQTRDGSLWIGTYGGGLTRMRHGRFATYGKQQGLPSGVVYNLIEDREGNLWIATPSGLCELRDGKLTTYTVRDGLAGNVVYSVLQDRAGDIWAGTYGSGVSRLHDGRFTTYAKRNGLGANVVLSIMQDKAGALWFATYGGGLTRLENGRFRTFTKRDGLTDDRLTDVREDRQGSLWIATYAGGVDRLRDGRFTSFAEREGLSDNTVLRLYEGPDGSVWIGTRFGGINRLRDGRLTPYSKLEGLSNNMVYSTYQDPAGRMWIGTEGGGLNLFENGKFTAYTTANGLASNNVVSLMSGPDGSLWAGTVGGGLSRLKDGKFTTFGARTGLAVGAVYALQRDRTGAMWFGTMDDTVTRLKDGKFSTFGTREGLPRGGVRVIYEDPAGKLWFGTNGGGLSWYHDGRFSGYTSRDGLPSDMVFSLLGDSAGNLWIGSKGSGLGRLKNGRFTKYTIRDGLTDNSVFQMLDDGAGHLWVCGHRGLARIDKRSLADFADGRTTRVQTVAFGRMDGMKSGQCNGGSQPGAWRAADGKLWFPTSKGVVVVDPTNIPIDHRAPWVYLEELRADDSVIAITGQVHLRPGTQHIEFHYTGINALNPDDVTFRYRLAGFDAAWVDAGTRRVAYYTNLPPGEYHFQVIASNRDGVVNRAGASVVITLAPYFYQTRWFLAIVAAFILLLGMSIYRWRMSHVRGRERELSILVAARTRELEEATERLEQLTRLDAMTGVANRRHFDEALDVEWRRALRSRLPLAVVMVDIDCFKRYNDAYGHMRGDECVREVARALQSVASRAGSVVARYGGEEFVVLLPAVDPSGALVVAERFRSAVEGLQIPHPYSDVAGVVTISAGVAAGDGTTADSASRLLADADDALYRAKHAGRNCVSGAVVGAPPREPAAYPVSGGA